MGIKLDTDFRLSQPNEPKEESKLKQETLVSRKMFSEQRLCTVVTFAGFSHARSPFWEFRPLLAWH